MRSNNMYVPTSQIQQYIEAIVGQLRRLIGISKLYFFRCKKMRSRNAIATGSEN